MNRFEKKDDYIEILLAPNRSQKLVKNYFLKLSEVDFNRIKNYNWRIFKQGGRLTAMAYDGTKRRFINKVLFPDLKRIHRLNDDELDFRRENIKHFVNKADDTVSDDETVEVMDIHTLVKASSNNECIRGCDPGEQGDSGVPMENVNAPDYTTCDIFGNEYVHTDEDMDLEQEKLEVEVDNVIDVVDEDVSDINIISITGSTYESLESIMNSHDYLSSTNDVVCFLLENYSHANETVLIEAVTISSWDKLKSWWHSFADGFQKRLDGS